MRLVFPAFFLLLTFSFFVSCQKEKSFEIAAPSIGSLKTDASGDCLPKTVVGAFVAGTALSDSNYMEIEVDVARAGSYTIRTDTVNGYSFTGIGNFEKTGSNVIRLAASGTPLVAKQDEFIVQYDTSVCFIPVTVMPAGSSGPAAFTLQGSGDTCLLATVSGTYTQNTPLTSTNTVAIKVNATTAGTYTITTNNINEFSFSGSGTIPAPGEHTLTLTASGTPATEGPTEFTVTAGSTTCTFTVNVIASDTPPPVATGDLFPLTANSSWSYLFDVNDPTDTLQVVNAGPISVAGNTYQSFEFRNANIPFDSFYYRKTGNDYVEYVDVNALIADLETDVKGDIVFLKENLAEGDTWNTDFDTKKEGNDITLRFAFSCTEANTTAVVNGKSFSGVYKITMQLQAGSGGVFENIGLLIESHYAKGVGLIYERSETANGSMERFINNWNIQ